MSDCPAIQPTLFGEPATLAGYHLVTAHTRVHADGSEVFVGEHLRWNRGRRAHVSRKPSSRQQHDAAQLALFAPPPGPNDPPREGTKADEDRAERGERPPPATSKVDE